MLDVILVLLCCIIVAFGVVFCVICVLCVREEVCLVKEGLIVRVMRSGKMVLAMNLTALFRVLCSESEIRSDMRLWLI